MSERASSAVFLSRSLSLDSKQILNVLCMISQTLPLVSISPTGDSMRRRSKAKIFINTTSSELGSKPTNLKYTTFLVDQ